MEPSTRFTAAEGGARLAAAAAAKNTLATEYASFISTRLVYEEAYKIRGRMSAGYQRSVYVSRASRLPAVAHELALLTDLSVAAWRGDSDSDSCQTDLDDVQVLVCTSAVLQQLLDRKTLSISNMNVLVIDSCHLISTDACLRCIMDHFKQCEEDKRPRVLALTYPLFQSNKKELEKVETNENIPKSETSDTNENADKVTEIHENIDKESDKSDKITEICNSETIDNLEPKIQPIAESDRNPENTAIDNNMVTDNTESSADNTNSEHSKPKCDSTMIDDEKDSIVTNFNKDKTELNDTIDNINNIEHVELKSDMEIYGYENLDDFEMYEKLEWKIEELEKNLCCQMDLAEDIDGGKRLSATIAKPKELIIEYSAPPPIDKAPDSYAELDKYMRETVRDAEEFIDDHRYDPTEIYGEDLYEEFKDIPDPTVDPKGIFRQFIYVLDELGPYAADKAAFALLTKLEKLKIKVPYERHFLLLCLCTSVFVKIRCYADYIFSKYESDWEKVQVFSTPKVMRFAEILEKFQPPEIGGKSEGNVTNIDTNVTSVIKKNDTNETGTKVDDTKYFNRSDVQVHVSINELSKETDVNDKTPDTKVKENAKTIDKSDSDTNDTLVKTNAMLEAIETCDFSTLGDKIEDKVNTLEANLKDLEYVGDTIHTDTKNAQNDSENAQIDNKHEQIEIMEAPKVDIPLHEESTQAEGTNSKNLELQKGIFVPGGRRGPRSRGRGRAPRHAASRAQQQLHPDALCAIVYMREALVAKVMFMVVVDMSRANPRLSYLCAQYCGESDTNEPKESLRQGKKQEEVLKKFRMHECNILLATPALEEGIDLPRCNLVLRWDLPASYRSYGLCRSRARAARASCALLVRAESATPVLHRAATYTELDQIISRKCGCGIQDEPPQEEEDHADTYTRHVRHYTPNDFTNDNDKGRTKNAQIHDKSLTKCDKRDDKSLTKGDKRDDKSLTKSDKSDDKSLIKCDKRDDKRRTSEISNVKSEQNNKKCVDFTTSNEDCRTKSAKIDDRCQTSDSSNNKSETNKEKFVNSDGEGEAVKRKSAKSDGKCRTDETGDDSKKCTGKSKSSYDKCIKSNDKTLHGNKNSEISHDKYRNINLESESNADKRSDINVSQDKTDNGPDKIKNRDDKSRTNDDKSETSDKTFHNLNYHEKHETDFKTTENMKTDDVTNNLKNKKCQDKKSDEIASVDLSTAVALINRYCGKLPSDTFTRLAPQWWMEQVRFPTRDGEKVAYICTLRLPLNCPIKYNIVGHPMPSRVLARRMVALRACCVLHRAGELDEQLLPVGKENFKAAEMDSNTTTYSTHAVCAANDGSEFARPGTTKRRQYYYKRTAFAFTDCQPVIDTSDTEIDPPATNADLNDSSHNIDTSENVTHKQDLEIKKEPDISKDVEKEIDNFNDIKQDTNKSKKDIEKVKSKVEQAVKVNVQDIKTKDTSTDKEQHASNNKDNSKDTSEDQCKDKSEKEPTYKEKMREPKEVVNGQEATCDSETQSDEKSNGKRNMLYAIVSSLWCALPERYNTRGRRLHAPQRASQAMGVLMARHYPDSLQIPPFPVYTRSGEVRVSIEHVPGADVRVTPRRRRLVTRFMHFVFSEVLRVRRRGMKLQADGSARNNYYIVPTIKTTLPDGSTKIDVDWPFLEVIYDHTEQQAVERPVLWERDGQSGDERADGKKDRAEKRMRNPLLKEGETFVFDPEKYREAVVTPWYRNQDQPQFFLVAEICTNLTPDSAFPSATHTSFRHYYSSKYGVTLTQPNQPLLDVDHTSARLNLLTPRYVNRKGVALPVSSERTRRAKRDRLDQKQILVPELCRVHPFAAPLWFATVALPCVLYRINALLIADEIRRSVAIDVGVGIPKIEHAGFQWPPLDFGWSLAEVLSADAEKSDKRKEEDCSSKSEESQYKEDVSETNPQDELPGSPKMKTLNDILQEKEAADNTFEIGTWSNEMAASVPDPEPYDEYSQPLPPNLTFCTSAEGGANWCDPIQKPRKQFVPSKAYSMADSDCSYISSDFDTDDSSDCDGSDLDDDDTSGFGSEHHACAAMGVRIEYKTAHEAEAVDLERKKVNPAPQPDEEDDEKDRRRYEEFIREGVPPAQYIEKFHQSIAKHKKGILENGRLIHQNEPVLKILPETKESHDKLDKTLGSNLEGITKKQSRIELQTDSNTVREKVINDLFPYGNEDILLHENGQIDLESIERNKRKLLAALKNSLPEEEIKKLECFSMVDIDIDSKDYVNEKVANIGFDTKESYEEKVNTWGKETEHVPYYDDGKGQKFDFDYQPKLEGHPGPSPSLILQALTMSNANDGINLERLETIGDSFLKFAITAYLYCAHPNVHEGKLSHMRSKQVSNLNLYRLGRNKRLGARMIASKFEPHDNWLPPCHKPPPTLHAKHTANSTENGSMSPEMPQDNTGCYIPYNLITQHSIPDKSIADCVEALIGAYLLECGPRGALLFMAWLGIRVLPRHEVPLREGHPYLARRQKPPPPRRSDSVSSDDEESSAEEQDEDWTWPGRPVGSLRPVQRADGVWVQPIFGALRAPPSPLLRYIADPDGELNRMLSGYDALEERLQYRFRDRSLLLQAMSHASHQPNRLTDCYQRLEFLGDAILDYLITRHLYLDPRRHSPGALTDLRSALVNNTIFATLAARHGFHKYFRHMSPGLNEVLARYVRIQEENGHSISEEHYLIQEDELEQAEDVEVPKALGDLFESVAGAIFLDSGMSLQAVWRSYERLMGAELEAFSAAAPKSPVRELLEAEPDTAKFGKPERLADGRRVRVCVEVFGRGAFKGVGRNYRIAKGTAARCALRHLKIHRAR